MASTTSSLSWTWPSEDDDKDKNKPGRVRNRPEKIVTVQGDPGQPPSVGVPQSSPGTLVPYIIGRQRCFTPNTLWYGNLATHYETDTEVVSRDVNETTDGDVTVRQPVTTIMETEFVSGYDLDVHLSLCLGPDVHLVGIYEDNNRIWDGDASGARTQITATSGKAVNEVIFYDGRYNQNVGGGAEIVEISPPGYVGIAIVNCLKVNATGVFPQISFEVYRCPNPLGLDTDVNQNADHDVNPMTALYDVIENPWGGTGLSSSRIDPVSLTAAAVRLAEEGNFVSIFNVETTPATEIIKALESQINGFIFEDPSDGLIKCRLTRWDLYDFDAAIRLDESNISELRDLTKSSWNGAATKSVATFTNREVDYTQDILMAQSPMVSGSSKEVEPAKYSYPMAMSADVAAPLLARDMILFNQPSWSCEVQCSRVLSDVLPGDLVLLTWAEYGFVNLPMIVTSRSDPAGDISIVAGLSELINVNDSVLFAIPEPSLFNPPDKDPTTPLDALVVSAPYYIQVLAGYDNELWNRKIDICTPVYLVESYNNVQSSFDVRMLNYPDQASPPVGDQPIINRNALYATVGQLPDPMLATDGFNDGVIDTLLINGVIRSKYLKTIGLDGLKRGEILMFIEDEILSFEAVEDQGTGIWELTNVHRGLLDTAPAAHSAGTKVWVINSNWTDRIGMSFDIVPSYIPHLRFCSVTPDDRQKDEGLDYSSWSPDDRINRPLRPVDIRLDGTRGSGTAFATTAGDNITVTWKTRNRKSVKKVSVFADASQTIENYKNGTEQYHRVWLTDSADNDYDLGVTSSSPAAPDTLSVIVPSGVVLGAGSIRVVAENAWGASIQAERYPINIT